MGSIILAAIKVLIFLRTLDWSVGGLFQAGQEEAASYRPCTHSEFRGLIQVLKNFLRQISMIWTWAGRLVVSCNFSLHVTFSIPLPGHGEGSSLFFYVNPSLGLSCQAWEKLPHDQKSLSPITHFTKCAHVTRHPQRSFFLVRRLSDKARTQTCAVWVLPVCQAYSLFPPVSHALLEFA